MIFWAKGGMDYILHGSTGFFQAFTRGAFDGLGMLAE